MTILQILRQLAHATETDAEIRLRELERQRAEIDAEIARVREGRIDILDPSSVRDRFQEVVAGARSLLSDFRAVEQSFRDLDRDVRERIATWDGGKGALLEDVFGARDAITDSDQGRSFTGFWDLLMSEARQEELEALLAKVLALDAVRELKPDRRIGRVHYDWIAAGESTQAHGCPAVIGAEALPRRQGLAGEPAHHADPARHRTQCACRAGRAAG